MCRDFQIETIAFAPHVTILDVVGETFLPRVDIDGGNALASLHQGYSEMDSNRGFTRATLFIADHDNICRHAGSLGRLGRQMAPQHVHDKHPRLEH